MKISPQHVPRQPQRHFRNIGDEHQHQKHHGVERPDLPHHLFDRDLADRASDEQDRSDRRMAQADAEVEQHDHPEVNGIDALSIEPGFYGQSFLDVSYKRMREFSKHRDAYRKETGKYVELQVDGGVTDKNIRELKDVGVDIAVAGSFVFKNPDPVGQVRLLKSRCL